MTSAANKKIRCHVIGISGPSASGKSTLARFLHEHLNSHQRQQTIQKKKKNSHHDHVLVSSPVEPLSLDEYGGLPPPASPPDDSSSVSSSRMITDGKQGWWEQPGCYDGAELVQQVKKLKQELLVEVEEEEKETKHLKDDDDDTKEGEQQEINTPKTEHVTKFIILEGFLLFWYPEIAALCDTKIYLSVSPDVCCARRYARSSKRREEDEYRSWYFSVVHENHLRHLPMQLKNAGTDLKQVDASRSVEKMLEETLEIVLG